MTEEDTLLFGSIKIKMADDPVISVYVGLLDRHERGSMTFKVYENQLMEYVNRTYPGFVRLVKMYKLHERKD